MKKKKRKKKKKKKKGFLTRQWRSKEIDAKGREARRSGGWGLSNVNL